MESIFYSMAVTTNGSVDNPNTFLCFDFLCWIVALSCRSAQREILMSLQRSQEMYLFYQGGWQLIFKHGKLTTSDSNIMMNHCSNSLSHLAHNITNKEKSKEDGT